MGYDKATARAATVRQVLAFASEFAPGRCGVIASSWFERDGQQVMEVYDWCDCWFSGPRPVLAWIIAPGGFNPPDEQLIERDDGLGSRSEE
jgi:hypothetical protein